MVPKGESEPRNKGIFLAGENPRADVSVYQTVNNHGFGKAYSVK
jgi:hypothetical protein